MKISVGFNTTEGWIARVIRWFTRSPRSHAFLHFGDEHTDTIFEASPQGFRMAPLWDRGDAGELTEIDVTKYVDVQKAYSLCAQWWNTPYDYRGLLGEAWVMFGKWVFGMKWENPIATPHAMFCSEACMYVLQDTWLGAWPYWLHNDPRSVDPGELMDMLSTEVKKNVLR